ncbi:MAG: error-prone DNA polymerase [Nocardioidaceae bacterium]|nr:error-prone DNA polymerase [Nocardioidaceae bacterium]
MGWHNPRVAGRELARRLSGRPPMPGASDAPVARRTSRREPTPVQRPEQTETSEPYAELHCHSHFSFLDGASSPAELVKESVRLGLSGVALTDHDGFAGAPLFAEAGLDYHQQTVYGAELTLASPQAPRGAPDPAGTHLLVLARGVAGYHQLCGAITDAGLRAPEKGAPVYDLDELAERGREHWVVLTGCRKGAVRQSLARGGPAAAATALDELSDRFGREHVVVELIASDHPGGEADNDLLAQIADERGLAVLATGNVHFAVPEQRRLAAAMAAVRARRSIADLDGWLDLSGGAHLRSGEEMLRRFARRPEAVRRSAVLADELAFDLRKATPRLPKQGIPEGKTASEHLRDLLERGFAERYLHEPHAARARARVEKEMRVICGKDFAGYFVIVHDIVAFARSQGILCQGRGSAASSAICYALGITAIDSVFYNLPFERFISAHREEEPDIDVDFDSDRREEVIQWVYETYGRRNAAQVCNVISYRPRMAVRDAAKALGFSSGQQDAWSKQIDGWGKNIDRGLGIPDQVVSLAEQMVGSPRHLGIHSGGMVLTERPIGEVCPIEKARMDKRTVLQWDKDGCESMGLVKFDLLGLGMLGALDHMMRLIEQHIGPRWSLASIPKEDPEVYEMLGRADSIGVFQVESRAQIGTLPRLKPQSFYELAIEIALIRPGPIQGGAVHPYIRRKTGRDPVTYDHPCLEPILGRTLGVPLFQEQLMQIAVALGDCTPDDADLLRRAMGSKRGIERIEKVKDRLYLGMARKGITGDRADAIYVKILSFAGFGFAESHALSFALLVYASSWFKLRYPAAFLAGLLRNQPMGFYSPQSLVADARRHGVQVRRPEINVSGVQADLEDGGHAVRLGLDSVKGIGRVVAEQVVAARTEAPYASLRDLGRRADLSGAQLEALATAGVFDEWGIDRRQALWQAGEVEHAEHLPGSTPAATPPTLPGMSPLEVTLADLWATRISVDVHPVQHFRVALTAAGIKQVGELVGIEHGRRVHVAGLITHRQRPGTAAGITFLNLEDETGMLNVVCSPGVMKVYRAAARNKVAVVIRGIVERQDGVTNLIADRVSAIDTVLPGVGEALQTRQASRDFR